MEKNSLIVDALIKQLSAPRLKFNISYTDGSTVASISPHYIVELQLRPIHNSKGQFRLSIYKDHVAVWNKASYRQNSAVINLNDPNLVTTLKCMIQSFFFPKWLDNPNKITKTRNKTLYKGLKCP